MNKATHDKNLIILKKDNTSISLLDYLNLLKKEEIFNLSIICLYFDSVQKYKSNISNLKKYKKNNLIEFIISNKERLIINYLKLSNKTIRKDLRYILRKINKNTIFKIKKLNKATIDFITIYNLGIIDTYTKRIKIVIPLEFIDLLIKYISDTNVIKSSNNYHKILNLTDHVLSSYGLITLSSYDKFYNNFIDKKYLEYNILCGSILKYYKLLDTKKNIIIYKNDIRASYVKDVYLNEYTYKRLSKKKLNKIYSLKFLMDNKFFKRFVTYVSLHFIINKKELVKVCLDYVSKYINNSQIDINKANEVFKKEFKSEFEVSKQELDMFIKWFYKIYKKYPKWSKKGYK